MDIVQITLANIHYIHRFLSNPAHISHHFRYFEKRVPEKVLGNHLLTLMAINKEDEPVAYGHIDREGKNWLGICVLEPYQGQGLGKEILKYLLHFADNKQIELSLTVDKENIIARRLYEKAGFTVIREGDVIEMIRVKRGINMSHVE